MIERNALCVCVRERETERYRVRHHTNRDRSVIR